MILIWKLIILEIFIWINTIYDGGRIQNNKPIYHGQEALVRLVFMTGLALVFNWTSIFPFVMHSPMDAWKELLFFICIFWQFDYTLNWIRPKPWWYLGTAKLDLILKGKNLRYWRLGLKISLVIGSLILLLI